MGKATLISSLHFDNYKNLFLLLPTTFSPGENIKILEIFFKYFENIRNTCHRKGSFNDLMYNKTS